MGPSDLSDERIKTIWSQSLEDYKTDLRQAYRDPRPEFRGGLVGGAGRRARRDFVGRLITLLADQRGLDLTVASARYLFLATIGRAPQPEYLARWFGTRHRTAANKTALFSDEQFEEQVETMGDELRPVARSFNRAMEQERERLAKGFKDGCKIRPNRNPRLNRDRL